MRTSPWERPYIWAEAQAGRLRQGWGTQEDQNLEVIAAALRRGDTLSESQREAKRALRMLTSWEHGMRVGDVVVAPNLPDYGRLSIARVRGSYEWAPASPLRFGERFGHVLPVEMLITDIDRRGPDVSDGLRSVPEEFDEVAAELGRTLDAVKVPQREKDEVLAAFAAHKGEVTDGYLAVA